MTKQDIERLIRRRYQISRRASRLEAQHKNAKLVDYHSGCMGVCLCLIDDVAQWRKKRKTP